MPLSHTETLRRLNPSRFGFESEWTTTEKSPLSRAGPGVHRPKTKSRAGNNLADMDSEYEDSDAERENAPRMRLIRPSINAFTTFVKLALTILLIATVSTVLLAGQLPADSSPAIQPVPANNNPEATL